MRQYLNENIVYPADAKVGEIEGRVIVQFVVDVDGTLQGAEVKQSPHESLSKAALGLIENMPKSLPGEQNGKKVPVYMMLPVTYNL